MENITQNNKENALVTPASSAMNMHVVHLGKIFFRLSIACAVLCIASVLTLLLTAVVYLIGFLLIICTLGMIFLVIPEYWSLLTSGGDFVSNLGYALMQVLPYLAPVAVVAGVLSIVCMLFDKDKRHPALIAAASIVAIIALVVFIVFLVRK